MSKQASARRLYARHAEAVAQIDANPAELFNFLDDHHNLSSHMESSRSPMMAGGKMQLILDDQNGRSVGSHIVMRGSVLGFELFVDEVVTQHVPGEKKTWETVGDRLVVIGAYRLGFRIAPHPRAASMLTVWIDYDLPSRRRWLGRIGGQLYAKWCVQQMLGAAHSHFG